MKGIRSMQSYNLLPGEKVIYYTDKASHFSPNFITAELILTNMNIVIARYPNKFFKNKNDISILVFHLPHIQINEGVARISVNKSSYSITIHFSSGKEVFEFKDKKIFKQWASGIRQLLLSMNLINRFDEDTEDDKAMTAFSIARFIAENVDL